MGHKVIGLRSGLSKNQKRVEVLKKANKDESKNECLDVLPHVNSFVIDVFLIFEDFLVPDNDERKESYSTDRKSEKFFKEGTDAVGDDDRGVIFGGEGHDVLPMNTPSPTARSAHATLEF